MEERYVQPPVKEGQELELTISEISHRGDSGIAKVNGFVVFVPGAQPGDRVQVRIVKVTSRWAAGEVISQNET
jgi:predicted RNA-binding protein with TRAM domain